MISCRMLSAFFLFFMSAVLVTEIQASPSLSLGDLRVPRMEHHYFEFMFLEENIFPRKIYNKVRHPRVQYNVFQSIGRNNPSRFIHNEESNCFLHACLNSVEMPIHLFSLCEEQIIFFKLRISIVLEMEFCTQVQCWRVSKVFKIAMQKEMAVPKSISSASTGDVSSNLRLSNLAGLSEGFVQKASTHSRDASRSQADNPRGPQHTLSPLRHLPLGIQILLGALGIPISVGGVGYAFSRTVNGLPFEAFLVIAVLCITLGAVSGMLLTGALVAL